jgi:hypothetical protein
MVRRRALEGPRPSEHYSGAIGPVIDLAGGFRMQATARYRSGLQTGHLLLWVVGCAVSFAQRRALMPADLPAGPDRVLLFGSNVLWGIALGTILTGCVLLAYRRWRGDTRYPSRAGHWLLLRSLAAYATWKIFIRSGSPVSASVSVLIVDLAFLWYLRPHLPGHWVAVFLVSGIAAAVRAALFMALERDPVIVVSLNPVSAGLALVDALVILWAVGRDRRSDVPTDGLHRLGIATMLAHYTLSAIFSLIYLAR